MNNIEAAIVVPMMAGAKLPGGGRLSERSGNVIVGLAVTEIVIADVPAWFGLTETSAGENWQLRPRRAEHARPICP